MSKTISFLERNAILLVSHVKRSLKASRTDGLKRFSEMNNDLSKS